MWLILLIIIFASSYFLLRKHKNYFKDRNVPFVKPNLILGNLKDTILGRKGIFEEFSDLYNHPDVKNEPFFGIFLLHKPTIVLKDPELIKRICIKDFNSFSNHYSATGRNDPFQNMLLLAKNQKWKSIRQSVSKFFTSGRMKAAFYLIEEKGAKLVQFISHKLQSNDNSEVSLKDVTGRFTMDSMGSLLFGIDAHSLDGVTAEFQKATTSLFDFNLKRSIELIMTFILPQLMKILDLSSNGKVFNNFMIKFLPEILKDREESGIVRNDFLDLVIQTRNDGISEKDLLAQSAAFLGAGYETSATTASFALYELSKNQEVQQRLRDEIKNSLAKNEGKISYEALAIPSEMPYLHQVVHETLRVYPSFPFLDRVCEEKDGYSLEPFSDFKIPYGMPVLIPGFALGHDKKYFFDPLKFDPERFEDMSRIHTGVHVPFGIGPRSCIGERLGLIQTKMAIVKILSEFNVQISDKTPSEVKIYKNAFIIAPEKPLIVNLVKDQGTDQSVQRNNCSLC